MNQEIQNLLFTLSSSIWAVRNILINDYGMSEAKANVAILISVDAEKQISPIEKYKIGIESYKG